MFQPDQGRDRWFKVEFEIQKCKILESHTPIYIMNQLLKWKSLSERRSLKVQKHQNRQNHQSHHNQMEKRDQTRIWWNNVKKWCITNTTKKLFRPVSHDIYRNEWQFVPEIPLVKLGLEIRKTRGSLADDKRNDWAEDW